MDYFPHDNASLFSSFRSIDLDSSVPSLEFLSLSDIQPPVASGDHAASGTTGKKAENRPRVPNTFMMYRSDFPQRYPQISLLERSADQRMRLASQMWDHEAPEVRAYYDNLYLMMRFADGNFRPLMDAQHRRERSRYLNDGRRAAKQADGKTLSNRSLRIFDCWKAGIQGNALVAAVQKWEMETYGRIQEIKPMRKRPARQSHQLSIPLSSTTASGLVPVEYPTASGLVPVEYPTAPSGLVPVEYPTVVPPTVDWLGGSTEWPMINTSDYEMGTLSTALGLWPDFSTPSAGSANTMLLQDSVSVIQDKFDALLTPAHDYLVV